MRMEICSITTARIYVFDIKFPMTISWRKLAELGAHIEFNTRGKKEWLVIYLPLKKVINITDSYELNKFVTKYIKL